jgi:RNA polymerase-binding transcription factor DksA
VLNIEETLGEQYPRVFKGPPRALARPLASFLPLLLHECEIKRFLEEHRGAQGLSFIAHAGLDGLYTHALFDLSKSFQQRQENALELGRSFVQPAYWGSRALDCLWQGIGAYLRKYPHIRHLYGPVSISDSYPKAARDALAHFYTRHYGLIRVELDHLKPSKRQRYRQPERGQTMDLADLADIQIEGQLQAALALRKQRRGAQCDNRCCSECNNEIPLQRRKLLPHVSTCVDCAEALELAGRLRKNTGTWLR